MSESEKPKTKTIYICQKCGWRKPDSLTCKKCGRCGASLVPKTIVDCEEEIIGRAIYTIEYRDRHWKPCRFGVDPRTCGSLHAIWKGREGKICDRDNSDCDAEWTGEKDE